MVLGHCTQESGIAMGCASDLVRGPITPEVIRGLACLVDQGTSQGAALDTAGAFQSIYQEGLTIARTGVGTFLVTLDVPVENNASGHPPITVEASAVTINGPNTINISTPVFFGVTSFVLSVFDNALAPSDPGWLSVIVHK